MEHHGVTLFKPRFEFCRLCCTCTKTITFHAAQEIWMVTIKSVKIAQKKGSTSHLCERLVS